MRSKHYEGAWCVYIFIYNARKRLKGKVMNTCVTPACLHGTETLALTEMQQQRLVVGEINWVRKIAIVKRAARRRMLVLKESSNLRHIYRNKCREYTTYNDTAKTIIRYTGRKLSHFEVEVL